MIRRDYPSRAGAKVLKAAAINSRALAVRCTPSSPDFLIYFQMLQQLHRTCVPQLHREPEREEPVPNRFAAAGSTRLLSYIPEIQALRRK